MAEVDNDMLILYKNGIRTEWPKEAFEMLSDKERAKYRKVGEKAPKPGDVKVIQHKGKNVAQKVIKIKPQKVTEPKDIKKVASEPIEQEPIEPASVTATDRTALKAYFSENANEAYYNKMPTKKMYELYLKAIQ